MGLQRAMVLTALFVVGCDKTLPLGTTDGGSMADSASGYVAPGDAGSGPAPSEPKCLGGESAIACSGADGSVTIDTCTSDCEAAAAACNVDTYTAQADCNTLCFACDTQSEVDCLQGTSCSALVTALNGQSTICGLPNAGGGSVDPACCAEVCEYAAEVGCNVSRSAADSECVSFCASSPNVSQLTCVQAVPCAMLVGALGGQGTVCGIGAPG